MFVNLVSSVSFVLDTKGKQLVRLQQNIVAFLLLYYCIITDIFSYIHNSSILFLPFAFETLHLEFFSMKQFITIIAAGHEVLVVF